jgi:hypothetical protein
MSELRSHMTTDGIGARGADTPQETAAGEIQDEKEHDKYALVLAVAGGGIRARHWLWRPRNTRRP